jgi:hypothetical protein
MLHIEKDRGSMRTAQSIAMPVQPQPGPVTAWNPSGCFMLMLMGGSLRVFFLVLLVDVLMGVSLVFFTRLGSNPCLSALEGQRVVQMRANARCHMFTFMSVCGFFHLFPYLFRLEVFIRFTSLP